MMSGNKQFIQRAKTALSDRWKKSHQKWLEEQRQKKSAQQQALKYQSALQLQTELAEIFGSMSAPAKLQQIRFPSDLVIVTRDSDTNNVYRFRWAKKDEEKIAQAILNSIKDSLNAVIMAHCQRVINTASMMPYPDNQYYLGSYPFISSGFRMVNIIDDILDVEITIQV